MSGRFKHSRPERRSPIPVFGVTEPDHSRPRHGKVGCQLLEKQEIIITCNLLYSDPHQVDNSPTITKKVEREATEARSQSQESS